MKKASIEQKIETLVNQASQVLDTMGFTLLRNQPHITGERAHLSLNKLVLLGIDSSGDKVVIKVATRDKEKRQLETEHNIRSDIETLTSYSGNGPTVPQEVFFGFRNGLLFFITEYVEQHKILSEHRLETQLSMLQNTIEGEEFVNHSAIKRTIAKKDFSWPIHTADTYLKELRKNIRVINRNRHNKQLTQNLRTIEQLFKDNKDIIVKFSNYLIHDDLMPHNFRINNKKIYFLDYSAIAFGNKFAPWARLVNYFTFSNPPLEKMIIENFKKNRSPEELESLRLFRLYKGVTLLAYYMNIAPNISGNFLRLTNVRIKFWQTMLHRLLQNKGLTPAEITAYIHTRDKLRSDQEVQRQKEIGHTV